MFGAFYASFQSTPANVALTSSSKPLPLPVWGWSRADTLCSVTHRYWSEMARHTLGWNGLLCVSEQGGGTPFTPLRGHTLKAGLTAPKVSGPRRSLQRQAKARGDSVSGVRQNGRAQSRRLCILECSFFGFCKVSILVKASFFTCKWLICHLGVGDCGQASSSWIPRGHVSGWCQFVWVPSHVGWITSHCLQVHFSRGSLLFLGFSSKFPFSLRRRVLLSPLFFSITKSQKILFAYKKGTPSMPFKGPSLKLDSVASLGNILMEISILMSCRKKKITLA